MHSSNVILKPVISEKSYKMIEQNRYTFKVNPRATKSQIKNAIEEIFKVNVIKVNTMNNTGKMKRQGWTSGRTPNYKKAIVTLQEGDRIEFFET